MHWMFNVVVGVAGEANAVLVRGAEPLDGWAVDMSGPAKLARAFGISRLVNGMDLTGDDIYFTAEPSYQARVVRTKRVGVDYARHWKGRLLRFIDVNSPVAAVIRY
jgi:DNA-3-methyladenine glycosylase